MGVHSGQVNRVTDINDRPSLAGSGINVAQRVLDCGDAGHILLSGHVAEDLCQYRHWQPHLHDLGECEVKHGLRLHLFNLYKDGFGNPQVPEKLKRRRWKQEAAAIRPVTLPRPPTFLLAVALLVSAVALGISVSIFFHRVFTRVTQVPAESITAASIPEKSIAVLPFENRSEDKRTPTLPRASRTKSAPVYQKSPI
jgi:Adenylate cyclase, family 3 (some proteins contain HAMP domain)